MALVERQVVHGKKLVELSVAGSAALLALACHGVSPTPTTPSLANDSKDAGAEAGADATLAPYDPQRPLARWAGQWTVTRIAKPSAQGLEKEEAQRSVGNVFEVSATDARNGSNNVCIPHAARTHHVATDEYLASFGTTAAALGITASQVEVTETDCQHLALSTFAQLDPGGELMVVHDHTFYFLSKTGPARAHDAAEPKRPTIVATRQVEFGRHNAEIQHVAFDGSANERTYEAGSGGCGLAVLAVTSGALVAHTHHAVDELIQTGEWAIAANGDIEVWALPNTPAEAVSWSEARGCKPGVGTVRIEPAPRTPLAMPDADGSLQLWPGLRGDTFGGILTGSGHTAEHAHRDSVEVFVIVDGTGTLEVNGKQSPLARGEIAVVPRNKRHSWSVNAGTKLRAVWFFNLDTLPH